MRLPDPSIRRASHGPRDRLLVPSLAPLLALTLLAGLPAAVRAQPSDTTSISTEPLFGRTDAWIAAGFVAGTVAMFPLDRHLGRRLRTPGAQERRFVRRQATNLRLIGEPGSLIIGATMYGVGRLAGNERMADLGLHGTEAILIGLGTTTAFKILAGRARPYVNLDDPRDWKPGTGLKHEERRSFPSGHTTMGFAAAAAVTAETSEWWPKYDWLIATTMYGGATLIGVSRMYDNKHWASDVVAGAAIGTFAGLKTVKYHHSHPGNRVDRWLLGANVTPAEGGGYALGLMARPMGRPLAGRRGR